MRGEAIGTLSIGNKEQAVLTVTAKGQATLRKDVLQHLGVRPGEKIIVDKLPEGGIQVKAAKRKRDSRVFWLTQAGEPTASDN